MSNAYITEEKNTISSSTIVTKAVPYYGSRKPKQSVIETDRVILQMMDDIQIAVQPELNKEEESSWSNDNLVPVSTTRKNGILWKFRIVFSAIVILLLVVATVVISELTKKEG